MSGTSYLEGMTKGQVFNAKGRKFN